MADLIAAVSTGSVRSAIGIVRMSGDGAIAAADRVFRSKNGKTLAETPSGKLVLGELFSGNGDLLDLCLCTVSRAPSSYTGEDTAEFQCHGSPLVLSCVLETLFAQGARQALPGEFTKRAFLNGKMDLVGAEAVIDLIDAETVEAAKNASGQLGGAVSKKTDAIYSQLLDMIAHFQAVIDYPDEDIDEFELRDYISLFENAESGLSGLLDTFDRGRLLRDGVKCAIVGRPNVGKSSLLNALLGYDRAIVTDVAGTTRDTVEEKCIVGGVLLRLIDTAGIRDTGDKVEKIGVERSREALENADLILAVTDMSCSITDEDMDVLLTTQKSGRPRILITNKSDIRCGEFSVPAEFADIPSVSVSAKSGDGLGELSRIVGGMFASAPVPQGEILTNTRQAEEVRRALDAVREAKNALIDGVTPDAVLTQIEEAMTALGAISGKNIRQDVIDRIFERFCVGK